MENCFVENWFSEPLHHVNQITYQPNYGAFPLHTISTLLGKPPPRRGAKKDTLSFCADSSGPPVLSLMTEIAGDFHGSHPEVAKDSKRLLTVGYFIVRTDPIWPVMSPNAIRRTERRENASGKWIPEYGEP
ncbi:sodium:proton antiporter [Anopheles sinensis]|uniref:Sodium:proton antiporter n=1 Tax=Anopheles sinensis TaxID=74873 RepID=A0A084WKE7_ANOSI|nr:sodium:proton antiporter [Anopheles sinensis]